MASSGWVGRDRKGFLGLLSGRSDADLLASFDDWDKILPSAPAGRLLDMFLIMVENYIVMQMQSDCSISDIEVLRSRLRVIK